jgi:hypothetical protein
MRYYGYAYLIFHLIYVVLCTGPCIYLFYLFIYFFIYLFHLFMQLYYLLYSIYLFIYLFACWIIRLFNFFFVLIRRMKERFISEVEYSVCSRLGNGIEEMVFSSWDGKTYILDRDRRCVEFQFEDQFCAFTAGMT